MANHPSGITEDAFIQRITANPYPPVSVKVWFGQQVLLCSTEEVTFDEAKAHVMITQQPGCIVREGARGPRGGRGKMHYNSTPLFTFKPNKFNRYFIVVGEAAPTPKAVKAEAEEQRHTDKIAALAAGYGMGPQQMGKTYGQQPNPHVVWGEAVSYGEPVRKHGPVPRGEHWR